MTLAVWFWVIYVLALLFGGYSGYQGRATAPFWWGGWLINAVLFFLVGLRIFGTPIKG